MYMKRKLLKFLLVFFILSTLSASFLSEILDKSMLCAIKSKDILLNNAPNCLKNINKKILSPLWILIKDKSLNYINLNKKPLIQFGSILVGSQLINLVCKSTKNNYLLKIKRSFLFKRLNKHRSTMLISLFSIFTQYKIYFHYVDILEKKLELVNLKIINCLNFLTFPIDILFFPLQFRLSEKLLLLTVYLVIVVNIFFITNTMVISIIMITSFMIWSLYKYKLISLEEFIYFIIIFESLKILEVKELFFNMTIGGPLGRMVTSKIISNFIYSIISISLIFYKILSIFELFKNHSNMMFYFYCLLHLEKIICFQKEKNINLEKAYNKEEEKYVFSIKNVHKLIKIINNENFISKDIADKCNYNQLSNKTEEELQSNYIIHMDEKDEYTNLMRNRIKLFILFALEKSETKNKYIQLAFDCYYKMMRNHASCGLGESELSNQAHNNCKLGAFNLILDDILDNVDSPFNRELDDYITFKNNFYDEKNGKINFDNIQIIQELNFSLKDVLTVTLESTLLKVFSLKSIEHFLYKYI